MAAPGPSNLLLALHPTHIDVTGIGAPGQLLPTQRKWGEVSVVLSTPRSLLSAEFHLPSWSPGTGWCLPHPLVPQLCGCGWFQLYLVQVVSVGRAQSVRLGDPTTVSPTTIHMVPIQHPRRPWPDLLFLPLKSMPYSPLSHPQHVPPPPASNPKSLLTSRAQCQSATRRRL